MTEKKETVQERLERMKREKEAAKTVTNTENANLVGQLTHQSDGEPDFSELAKALQERKAQEGKGENDDHVKMTIYIQKPVAEAFNALCVQRGDQKRYANQALAEFVERKARELGINK